MVQDFCTEIAAYNRIIEDVHFRCLHGWVCAAQGTFVTEGAVCYLHFLDVVCIIVFSFILQFSCQGLHWDSAH